MWIASLILLGFVLQQVDKPQLRAAIVVISVLGILMNVQVWSYTYQLADVKKHKYDRCKAIERQLGLRQHDTLYYASGRQKRLYSIVMLLFIVVWLVVAVTALYGAPRGSVAEEATKELPAADSPHSRTSTKVDQQSPGGDVMEMESSHRAWICAGVLIFGAVFCVANVWRSVTLKKGYSEQTIKMQVAFVVFTVLGVIAVTGVVEGGAMAALLGGAAGYALGDKPWKGADNQ